MRGRDPIEIATAHTLEQGLLNARQVEEIRTAAAAEVVAAWEWADAQPIAQPSEEELLSTVYAP